MTWTSLDTWIVITGILSAIACGIPGCFLVLRKMSMMGDAISHAVLPGLALAFLFTHSRDSLSMFIGAAAVGVLTALFIDWVNRLGRVEESAAMGVVFTTLFALGLILIVRGADHVDLDPGCVLYGAVELVPLDTVSVAGWPVPRAVLKLSVMLLLNIGFVCALYKELLISTFDPALSDTQGIPSKWMNFLLMGMVATTAVAAFESVGSILVIAMMIVPAATAQLTTDRLSGMLWISGLCGVRASGCHHSAPAGRVRRHQHGRDDGRRGRTLLHRGRPFRPPQGHPQPPPLSTGVDREGTARGSPGHALSTRRNSHRQPRIPHRANHRRSSTSQPFPAILDHLRTEEERFAQVLG